MKKKIFTIVFFAFLVGACGKVDSDKIFKDTNQPLGGGEKISSAPMQGKINGRTWASGRAYVRSIPSNNQKLSLHIYSEKEIATCSQDAFSQPSISIIIPSNYEVGIYSGDITSGNPIVFQYGSNNLIADQAKYEISNIHDLGFSLGVRAQAIDQDDVRSEVDGKVDVVDCRKRNDFDSWNELSGSYYLYEFDGRSVASTYTNIDFDRTSFSSVDSHQNFKSLVFKLFAEVSDNYTHYYKFGPMEGIGKNSFTEMSGSKFWNYIYEGPINFRGQTIELKLKLQVEKSDREIFVYYSLDVPGYVNNIQHNFKMK